LCFIQKVNFMDTYFCGYESCAHVFVDSAFRDYIAGFVTLFQYLNYKAISDRVDYMFNCLSRSINTFVLLDTTLVVSHRYVLHIVQIQGHTNIA